MRYLPVSSTREDNTDLSILNVLDDGSRGSIRHFSFSQLHQWSSNYASFLYSRGVRKGERVCLYLPNSLELVISLFGNHLLGVITVPVNPLSTREELEFAAREAEISAIVTADDRADFSERKLKLSLRQSDFWSATAGQARGFAENQDEDAGALLCFTSGTTARPKGALISHRNIRSNLKDLIETWGWSSHDSLLLSLPLFHVHGLGLGLHGWAMTGCRVTILNRFRPRRVVEELSSGHFSMFMGVPTMYRRLADCFDPRLHDLSRLRLAITGSAGMPVELHEQCRKIFGQTLLERYGMTETFMNSSNTLTDREPGSAGRPLPSVRIRLRDDQGRWIEKRREPGEVCVQGPNVFSGYWKDSDTTKKSFIDGWFRTGDLGYLDEEGRLYLMGRVNVDFIKSGGNRIGAREVEEVLEQHPSVEEAAVLGLPDTELGEKVVAVVIPKGGVELEGENRLRLEEDLLSHCKKHLALYKCPREIRFVSELPKNAMGKVQKNRLKAQ